ncbi:MAG TPA: cellulase family glycosylhydrolase [Gaiellaceae bacterium]|nr:cellulase family glycosylhydrolase [Gaiellaceae bacterium]
MISRRPRRATSAALALLAALLGLAFAPRSAAAAPVNLERPSISGSPVVGKRLRAAHGDWSGSPTRFAYGWQRCDKSGGSCRRIAGASSSRYRLKWADRGHTIRVRVKAWKGSASRAARSAPTDPVRAPALRPLHVSGKRLLDSKGKVVHLHGVNRSGLEYACIQGWGIFDGPSSAASVKAIRSWNANIVHLGLNEDCILGINGVPGAYAGENYMDAVVAYVNRLHRYGLYAEVSLMWAAPGTQEAQGHPPILDADHAGEALTAIAKAFKGDPRTIIGLQSEPHEIGWNCWRNGGSACSVGYEALGMQGALNAVRATEAKNPVAVPGIDWANNLSGWLDHKPNDPVKQLIAEVHVYGRNTCSTTSCFNSTIAPVAAEVPVVFGETGETYDDSSCGSANISTFMNWADAHGVGYEAWVWNTWGTCGSLIERYDGTPANAYGSWVKQHLKSLR